MTTPPMAEAQDVCASDPNFAVIFAFCERFGDSCGVTIPTFQELQEMLEKTNQAPDALVDLHIKLLRRVKKSVHVDKWERAILKFCQEYSIPEIWELESYGYKGISIQLKLKILKTLFEAQFDSNPKFKAEINKLESSTLRSQPLGWDKLGTAYWLQFDRASNLRVYKEDIDEDTWKIVAKDRSTLVNLINELSGSKDDTLDDIEDSNSIETGSGDEVELSPGLDQELNSPTSPNSSSTLDNVKEESKIINSTNVVSAKDSVENLINIKKQFNENDNVPVVGETIEESVMIVKGEGSGEECDTGNPDETNTQNETSKNDDVKKPKLWSIETICSSSKEEREEIISVPKTGFFFGDDSVPCFNNVSNGESSHIKEEKLITAPLNDNEEEMKSKNKTDEIDSVMSSNSEESFNKKSCSKNEDDFSSNCTLKQSVFNIKVHEREVQITERKANEVFTKSNLNIIEDTHPTNVHSTSVDTLCKSQESQLHQTTLIIDNDDNQSQICDKVEKHDDLDHHTSKNIDLNRLQIISEGKFDCKNIEDDQKSTAYSSSLIDVKKQTEQDNLSLKSLESSKEEPKKQFINDHKPETKMTEPKTNEHIFDSKIEIGKPTTDEINQNDELKKVNSSCEMIMTNESTITLNKCININEKKSIDIVEQDSCELDTKMPLNIETENQILKNKSKIINSKEEVQQISNSIVEGYEINKQVSEDFSKPAQTTDDKITIATYKNDNLSQSSSKECPTINAIDLNIKAHDDTKTDNVNPCLKTSKFVDENQIIKKPKNTSHNISNIIKTEVTIASDNIEPNEQTTNTVTIKNKQQDICQITSNNNPEKNIIQEEKKCVMNIESQTVFSSKHSLDNILKKSEEIKEKIEFPNLENEASKNIEIKEKPAPSGFEFDSQKIPKPVISVEKLETKCLDISNDLTTVKNEHDIKENNKSIDLVTSNIQGNEIVGTVNKTPSIQEKKELIEQIDKIPSVQENKIAETLNKIQSVQEKELIESINKIPSVQENKIAETLDKIQSVQKKELIETTDKISTVQEKKIVETLDKIPSIQEKEIVEPLSKIPSVQEKQLVETEDKMSTIQENKVIEMIDKTSKIVKIDDKASKISTEQCSKDNFGEIPMETLETRLVKEEITQNENQNEKSIFKNTKTKNDTFLKEKLNSEKVKNSSDNDKNLIPDSSETKEVSKEIDEENADETLQNADKFPKNYQTIVNEVKEEVNNLEDIKIQYSKIIKDKEDHIQNLPKENILRQSEEQEISSPVHEDMYESNNETNENTFVESFKEELDDSEMMDQTIEESDKKSDEEAEEVPKKKGRPGRKKGKRGRAKKNSIVKQDNIKNNSEEKIKRPYKPRQKKVVTISEEVTVFPEPAGEENIRRSRRIAEIKIKEQFVPYDDIDLPSKSSKKKDKGGKKGSTPSKKVENIEVSDEEDEEDPISKKFKKKKRKGKPDSLKKLNVRNPWNVDSESSSSENNIGLFEDYDHEEEDEIPRPGIEPNVSDHEFSPESDINDDDEEYLPEKRARTAHKKDEDEQLKDDMPCQKCNKSDQPEWILLCDTCNQGWHASCLRPPLMVIPDGDWYCPHCRHESLLNALKDALKKYDGESKKRENEELRRKRLAYVGISLQNVITSKTDEAKTEKPPIEEESSEDEEESESESYDSEPLYQLRARRQANVSYRFNDYDDMINEAILEETGVDESAVKKSIDGKTNKKDNGENTDSDYDQNDREDSPIAPALLHLRGRKKSKKLTNLDISSDDGSDEDFKGPSDGDDDYEEDLSEYSDDSIKKQVQPTRRSVRSRKTVVDPDFINDDSSEESDHRSKKKRSRPWSDSSNSEEEDFTWGKKKKKRTNAPSSSSLSSKQNKGSKRKRDDDSRRQKKSKIKYGMDLDSDSDSQPKRRTRGRQITYAESDDSEEEVQVKKRKVASDEEDEYVLNEEELEVENEDQNLEVDEDVMASNDEKDEELDEEDVVDEEEDNDDDEEEDEPKLSATAVSHAPRIAEKSAIVQSVIKGPPTAVPISPSPSSEVTDFGQDPQQTVHPRLLPPVLGATSAQVNKTLLPPLSVVDPVTVGIPDKRKRPSQQLKKSLSPNSSVDYGGSSSYPFPPDATKVVVPSVSLPPPVHVPYNRPPPATGGFKPMSAPQPPPGGFPVTSAPYRMANKIVAVPAPPAYLPQQQQPLQVQQVYQTPPLPANYSSYPIDYANSGTPLPPPPPTIAFRNVVSAPSSHEPHPSSIPTQQSTTAGGDSEFGGLVSYFSSQQEDDFDS